MIAWTLSLLTGVAMATEPALPARVSQAIEQRVADGQVSTMVVAVVDGEQSHIYTFGRLDNGRAPTADTVYEIGSITKTFTATLLADEVVHGKLKLEQPLASLLPGVTLPAKDGQVITLANVAEQNSGLPRMPDNFKPANPKDPYADYGPDQVKAFLAAYALPRDPGTQYEYSNLAVGLLGYALGEHAGTSYSSLAQASIFQPLGMRSTSVAVDGGDPPGMAVGHNGAGDTVAHWHFDVLAAAGGIRSTGADMLRYLLANMGHTPSPLLKAMQLAQTPRVATTVPNNRIGLIWMTRHEGGPEVIWHNGATLGFTSFIGFTADRQHGVVILSNAATPVDDLGFAMFDPNASIAPSHKRITLPTATLKAYIGAYQLSPQMVLHITQVNDHLAAQATGQGINPLNASAMDEFFLPGADIAISFKRGTDGKVDGLVLHQHGEHAAKRISDAEAANIEGGSELSLSEAALRAYIGSYDAGLGSVFVVTLADHRLAVQFRDQPSVPVYASATDHFSYRVVNATLDFQRDESGRVSSLTLHQQGVTLHAEKIVGK